MYIHSHWIRKARVDVNESGKKEISWVKMYVIPTRKWLVIYNVGGCSIFFKIPSGDHFMSEWVEKVG